MRWTIETERKNDEFRLSLSLSHTRTRARTHTRKKKHEKIYLCVVHAFRASNPERIKTDEKRILFVPTITIDSVRSEALVLCSFLLTR